MFGLGIVLALQLWPTLQTWELKLGGQLQSRNGFVRPTQASNPWTEFFVEQPPPSPALRSRLQVSPLFDLIVRPLVQVDLRLRGLEASLSYTPRMLLRLTTLGQTGPAILHALGTNGLLGDERSGFFNLGAGLSIGALDVASAGSILDSFDGLLGDTVTGAVVNYVGLNGSLGYRKPIGRSYEFSNNQLLSTLSSPVGSSQRSLEQINAPIDVPIDESITLQTRHQITSKTIFWFLLDEKLRMGPVLNVFWVHFPLTAAYLGGGLQYGLRYTLNEDNRFDLQAGVSRYVINRFRGRLEGPRYLPDVIFSFSHRFNWLRLPRLSGQFTLGVAPFADLLQAQLAPRAQVSASFDYRIRQDFSLLAILQTYWTENPDNLTWPVLQGRAARQPLAPNANRQILMTTLGAEYRMFENLAYQASLMISERWVQVSGTQPFPRRQQLFFVVGIRGSYDI